MTWILITCVSSFSFASAKLVQINAYTTGEKVKYCETNNSICGTAPEEMMLLMNFVREMSNSIQTIWTEWDYLGQYVNPNRFKWNVFDPPVQIKLGRLARNISQKIKLIFASTAIFSNPVNFAGLKDIVGWTVLLTKNKVFLRDTKVVEELESILSEKKYELGVGGGWSEKIHPENLQIMRDIIQQYKDEWLLVDPSNIEDGAVYNNVTSLLTSMLSAAKSFLYFDSIDQFNEISRWGKNGINVTFSPSPFMDNMRIKYSCARGLINPCDSALATFKKNMKNIGTTLSDSVSKSVTTFSDAGKRIGEFFKKEKSDEFKERETDLLKSMYGVTKVSTSTGFLKGLLVDPFKKTRTSIKKSWSEVGKQFAEVGNDVSKFRQFPKNLKDATALNPPKEKSVDLGATTATTDYQATQNVFTQMMNEYINDVFANHKADVDLALFSDIKELTPAFTVLWKQIDTTKKNILGGKQKNNSLLQSLWVACELQCGRFGLCR